jgi:hypothetical protein
VATLLKEAIDSIRSAKHVLETVENLGPESRAFYENRIKQGWEEIRIYRSNEPRNVFVVDGLFDGTATYLSLKEMEEDILDVEEVMIEDELELSIRLIKMTGREYGRLECIYE